VVLAVLAGAEARPCDSSSCSLLTRNQGGVMLRPGGIRVDLSYRQTDQRVKLEGTERVDEVFRPKLYLETGGVLPALHEEEEGREGYLQLDVGYGLDAKTSLQASIPLSARRSYEVSHLGFTARYRTTGVGDVLVGVKRTLGPVVAGLSLKLPTGDHDRGPDFDGSVLDPMLQPGSGSVDVVGTVQHAFQGGPLQWTLAASYQRNGESGFSYRYGDEAIATVAAGRKLAGGLSGTLQVKLFDKGRSRFRGEDVASTGATFVYLTPGLRYGFPGGASVYAFYQALPYRRVNDTQLAPRQGFLVGMSKEF
jgi:hypothetical protein